MAEPWRTLAAALIALALTRGATAAQLPDTGDRAAVRIAEDALNEAIASKNEVALRALLADDFTTGEEPRLDRAAWIGDVLRLCGGGRIETRDQQIVVQGNTAFSAYLATTNKEESCDPSVVRTRVADVWRLVGASWRLTRRSTVDVEAESRATAAAPSTTPSPALRPSQFAGTAELTILNTRGNVNTLTFGSTGDIAWQRGPWRTNGRVAFLRTTTEGLVRARSFSVQIRESRTVSSVVEVFGRGLYQRDLFAGILDRYGGDAGIGLTIAHDGQRLQATFGAGSTREERVNVPIRWVPNATAGVQYRLRLSPSALITEDALVTESLVRAANLRVESVVAVQSVLRSPFSLRVSYQTKYLNEPVPGFKRLDAILSLSLVARF